MQVLNYYFLLFILKKESLFSNIFLILVKPRRWYNRSDELKDYKTAAYPQCTDH
jgi:hypothetical protein